TMKSTLDSTTSPLKILDPASMSLGTTVHALWSGMFSIELNAMVTRRNIANPMTPVQKTHHCNGSESKTLQPKPTPPNPITVTREKFALLCSAVSLVSSVPSLTHPPPDQLTSTQAPGESQYTYKYETLDHKGLVNCMQEEFGLNICGCNTQMIIDRIQLATAEQASQIIMLPPTPFQVGGSWSQEVVGGSQSTCSCKRTSQVTMDLSKGTSTHQCMEPLVDDDTATEPETNDELTVGLEPPQCGKQALSPSCKPTATTILDSQLSNMSLHSLGGSVTHSHPCLQAIRFSVIKF
ncbi:hypothetical protein FRC11_014618, partial [Ceratobasidium sp. 423]